MPGPLIDVLTSRPTLRRPIWLMRQAGRYLPEYREVRSKAGSFLDLCYNPALAAEVTLQPLRRFDLDAAILFSDILVVPHAMGLDLAFVENEGPKLQTVRSLAEVKALSAGDEAPFFASVAETVSRVKAQLAGQKSLIGFCGAPWTVASYMIEGQSSDRRRAREAAVNSSDWFDLLIEKLVGVSSVYLKQQIEAGVEVVQIFDSWAGDLPAHLRDRYVKEPIREVVESVREAYPDFPVIVFARGVGTGHSAIAAGTRANAVSVEQGIGLSGLLKTLPSDVAVQGNLDPDLLLGDSGALRSGVLGVLNDVPLGRHIFNLGHGISQHTNPEKVAELIAIVRSHDGTPA